MTEIYDVFFHVIHLTVIIINTTFWMSFRTLRLAQITLSLTLISWIGFGFKYGFGYCFLTDWHWQLKESMGDRNLPMSYIKLVLDRTFGGDWNPEAVDKGTTVVIFVALLGCIVQTIRSIKRRGFS